MKDADYFTSKNQVTKQMIFPYQSPTILKLPFFSKNQAKEEGEEQR